MKKTLLQEIKAMNKIAGTKMTKEQEITIIKEILQQLNENESFAKIMQKLNPSWSKESVMKSLEKEYQKKEISKEEYKQYTKYAEKWFDKMEKNKPSVKVGDLVIVNPKSTGLQSLGKIVGEDRMSGDYMVDGNPEPKKIPAWKIELYSKKRKSSNTNREPINYKGNMHYPFGIALRYKHDEGIHFKKA